MSARSLAVAGTTASRRITAQSSGLVLTAGLYVLVTTTLAGIWRGAAGANNGAVSGYGGGALTWYIAASEAVVIAMNSRLIADIGRDIVSGGIAVELLRPVSVLGQRIAGEVGSVLPRLALCASLALPIGFVTVGRPPNTVALLLAVPSLILAIICNVVAQHAFAGAAFWFRETGATWFLYQKMVFMTGGMLLPLEVLPGWLHRVALFTPFPSMAYVPGRLASGFLEPELLLVQVGWIAAMAVVARFVFNAGERRLQVVGG